jgi:hypothetical protein
MVSVTSLMAVRIANLNKFYPAKKEKVLHIQYLALLPDLTYRVVCSFLSMFEMCSVTPLLDTTVDAESSAHLNSSLSLISRITSESRIGQWYNTRIQAG